MIVLYTAILGDSDSLKPAPREPDRCVCFTDDVAGTQASGMIRLEPGKLIDPSCGWDVRPWTITEAGARRDAWRLRCGSTTLFPKAGITVWLDASFDVKDFGRLIADFRALNVDAASMRHPERTTCYDEGREIIRLGQSEDAIVRAQLLEYERDGFMPKSLSSAGVLIRRRTPRVEAFNRLWHEHIQRFGDNTQVSLDYCAWKVGLTIGYLKGTYPDNPYMAFDGEDHHARRRPYLEVGE
jgi:hypothetical protein